MTNKIELLQRMTSQLLRWWGSQLYACGHDLLGILIPKRRQVLKVYWDASRLLFVDENTSDQEPIAEISLVEGKGQLPLDLPDSLMAIREQNNRARLYVSPARAYLRQFQLPIGVVPHLDAAIGLQLPKLLPIDPTELLTDFEVTARDSAQKMADIEVVALKKAEVNAAVERLKAWGLRVASIHLGEPSEARSRFRFGGEGAFGHRLRLHRSDRILAGAAAVLGLACASVAATESLRSHVSLEHAKSVTRAAAAAALAHRQELLARLEPLHALAQLEAAPSATALLADVTMLVPQNTWLTTLEFKDQNLRIVGVSPTSSNVVKLLSGSQLLNEVELRSSTSLGIGTGLDRFEITAQLKARTP
jgi:general secretion pathway protein L